MTSTIATAGTTAFGSLSGPDANGATPLLSSAITKRNNTRIAPLYTINWMTAINSAVSEKYVIASAAKCSNNATTLYTGFFAVITQTALTISTMPRIQNDII